MNKCAETCPKIAALQQQAEKDLLASAVEFHDMIENVDGIAEMLAENTNAPEVYLDEFGLSQDEFKALLLGELKNPASLETLAKETDGIEKLTKTIGQQLLNKQIEESCGEGALRIRVPVSKEQKAANVVITLCRADLELAAHPETTGMVSAVQFHGEKTI